MGYCTMWAYAWDIEDEGIVQTLQRFRHHLDLDAISIAAKYHSVEQFRPRAQAHKWFIAREAALYFQPRWELYRRTRFKPHVSPLAIGRNPLAAITAEAEAIGLKVIAWTVCFHDSFLGHRYPEAASRNAFGDVYHSYVCPANPDAQAFIKALCCDLDANYPLWAIELESLHYGGVGHFHKHEKFGVDLGAAGMCLLGLCFCENCMRLGQMRGVDMERLRRHIIECIEHALRTGSTLGDDVRVLFERLHGLREFLRAREDAILELLRDIKRNVSTQVFFIIMGDRWTMGINPTAIGQIAHRVEVLCYTSDAMQVQKYVGEMIEWLGTPDKLTVGLQAYPPASPNAKVLLDNVRAALDCGVTSFSFYHHGIMPEPNFDWVRDAVKLIRGTYAVGTSS